MDVATLAALILSRIPDNNLRLITPAKMREVLDALNARATFAGLPDAPTANQALNSLFDGKLGTVLTGTWQGFIGDFADPDDPTPPAPDRLYCVTDGLSDGNGGTLAVTGYFATAAAPFVMESATIEGRPGLWRYELANYAATPQGPAGALALVVYADGSAPANTSTRYVATLEQLQNALGNGAVAVHLLRDLVVPNGETLTLDGLVVEGNGLAILPNGGEVFLQASARSLCLHQLTFNNDNGPVTASNGGPHPIVAVGGQWNGVSLDNATVHLHDTAFVSNAATDGTNTVYLYGAATPCFSDNAYYGIVFVDNSATGGAQDTVVSDDGQGFPAMHCPLTPYARRIALPAVIGQTGSSPHWTSPGPDCRASQLRLYSQNLGNCSVGPGDFVLVNGAVMDFSTNQDFIEFERGPDGLYYEVRRVNY